MDITEAVPANDVLSPIDPNSRPPVAPSWALGRRILFRFAFAYFVLYSLPFPVGVIPGTEKAAEAYESAWKVVVPWVGKHVLRLESDITIFTNGSGDTTYDYVRQLCMVVIAAFCAGVWVLVDRRRTNHPRLHGLLRVYLRYVLAFIMLGYGMNKVIKLQFPAPSPERLLQTYGDSSPMGLLWTFMGFSTGYTFFAGFMEVLGGVLLFLRRTTTLGALVLVGVMTNVVILNFCYDTPVKLYSSNLLLMALFLLLPDLGRLANVLVLNRAAKPVTLRGPRRWRALRWGEVVTKLAVVGYMLYINIAGVVQSAKLYGPNAPKHALCGLYEVETFTRDDEVLAPLITETSRWRRLAVTPYMISIRMMDDSRSRYGVKFDDANQKLTLNSFFDASAAPQELRYTRPDEEHLSVEGALEGRTIRAVLRKVPESSFFLMNRGFHWINEYPLNR